MGRAPQVLLIRWGWGAIIGTALIAVTSPWFVRSYLPLVVDPLRRTWTLAPGYDFRWRSEGYATTAIGPHGMPGKTKLPAANDNSIRVALWGDSQAEGVCVADNEKLFALTEQAAEPAVPLTVLPFARSGEDAAIWLSQMPQVERELGIDAHAILVVDLSDLAAATDAPVPPLAPQQTRAAFASYLPAFVIQAARRLLTEPDGVTPRRLRFGLGPVAGESLGSDVATPPAYDWPAIMQAINQASTRPVIIVYAPQRPQIVDGQRVTETANPDQVPLLKSAARTAGIRVLDVRDQFLNSANNDAWPHGFHNGQIGVGHLNATGNRIVGGALADAVAEWVTRD